MTALDPISGVRVDDAKPWLNEPDYESFSASGLVCVVRRNPDFKNLCGYVGVPRAHPLFEVDRSELVPAPGTWKERPFDVDEHGAIDTFVTVVNALNGEIPADLAPLNMLIGVHGGLTWSDRLHDHTGWWFGFDCGHAWDYMPGMVELLESTGGDASFMRDSCVYRTFDYVKQECATLAQQIADWTESIPHVETARKVIQAAREARHDHDTD